MLILEAFLHFNDAMNILSLSFRLFSNVCKLFFSGHDILVHSGKLGFILHFHAHGRAAEMC